MHDVWLLVEFLAIEVLNSNSDFSGFLDMEPVGHEREVWVEESHEVGYLQLEFVSWVEQQLDPSTRYGLVNAKDKVMKQLDLGLKLTPFFPFL